MARILGVLLFFILLFTPSRVLAEQQPLSTLVTVQNVSFEQCVKMYNNVDTENLFFLTMASINANRFNIVEIQSKTGYILFNAVGKEFLAKIIKIDDTRSLLKITPTNNIYYFQPGIVLNLFKYIELNSTVKPIELPVI